MRSIFYSLCFAATLCVLGAQEHAPSAQVQRGRELFVNSTKGQPCATCHALAGVGTAVGPDLRTLCSAVGPHGIIMAMHMTLPAYVKEIKLKDGTTFPAMDKQAQGGELEIWDLSQTPPAARKLATKDIASSNQSTTWKHPPATVEYTTQELADIVGFLKWV
ncbi:MAG TPA: c-type cytochrome, partial [Candidatus Acidoferrum sp.]|nr:c-type cytochrome [Candidatus Acidoferrum sp.]